VLVMQASVPGLGGLKSNDQRISIKTIPAYETPSIQIETKYAACRAFTPSPLIVRDGVVMIACSGRLPSPSYY
jgi:hypothetical protein